MNPVLEQAYRAAVGDKLYFQGERLGYTIQARSVRYLVCNKPFNPRRTVLYCIVDLVEKERGPENLIFGMGAETRAQCEQMLGRIMAGQSELSYRRKCPLELVKVVHK